MLKKNIYCIFSRYYKPCRSNFFFQCTAQLLQKIGGLAVFEYGGVKLTAGPVAYLDNFIINGRNINPYVTSAVSQYLADGGVFLDIGANHGVLSLLAARNPKIKVFAFEPSHRELTRLWKNLELNPKNNMSVLAFGIGQEEVLQDLVLSNSHNPGMNSLPAILNNGTQIKCNFSPLQNLLSDNILSQTRVCKLDVEGQEMVILKSLRPFMQLLKQSVFVIEVSPRFLSKIGMRAEEIYKFFEELGFKYQFGNPDNLIQWEEFFYHPQYSEPLNYSEEL